MNASRPSMADLRSARAFLLDGDGTLYAGHAPLPGAQAFLIALRESSLPYLLLTNNATRTPEQVANSMAAMGIPIPASHVYTSSEATAAWLNGHYPPTARVLLVGEAGIRTALLDAGFPLVEDHREADVVVTALDRQVTYAKLAAAALAIRRGCSFIATNPDRSIPTERGLEPGAGAILAFLEAATDVSPILIGKPQPAFFHSALARMGAKASETVVVGDRYETDILGGAQAGLFTAAVLTGVTSAAEFAVAEPAATWVFNDLTELMRAWRG